MKPNQGGFIDISVVVLLLIVALVWFVYTALCYKEITLDTLKRGESLCETNGGVKTFSVGSFMPSTRLARVMCENGAEFDIRLKDASK